ncbi:MAG: hypothetical protein U1F16_06565 [Turneriella sp.]
MEAEIPAGSPAITLSRFGSPTKYTLTQLAALPIAEAVRKSWDSKGIKEAELGPSRPKKSLVTTFDLGKCAEQDNH